MIVKLTPELRDALSRETEGTVTLEDEQSHQQYVLVPAALYERLRSLLPDDDVLTAAAAQSAVAGAAGWDDPEMDIYDNYERHRRQP
jgi:hypothetical protein